MHGFTIKVEDRSEHGKAAVRRMRAEGKVPAVVYGVGIDALSLSVSGKELGRIVDQGARGRLVKLEKEDGPLTVVLKEITRHPVSGSLLHADFHKVALDQLMNTEVSVVVVGENEREVDGAVVVQGLRHIMVECLPTEIPEYVEANVANMEIGNTLRSGDLTLPEGVTLVSDAEAVVVTVTAPSLAVEEETTADETEEQAEKAEEATEEE